MESIPIQDKDGRRRGPVIMAIAQLFARNVALGKSRLKTMCELFDQVVAWENQNVPRGQMPVVYVNWDGTVLSERPPLTQPPATKK
jgi:hypothetical protein